MDANFLHSIRHTTTVVLGEEKRLIGSIKEGAFGVTYKAFIGIPYAIPPLGPLRFKDPVPLGSWSGERIVTDDMGTTCAQLCRKTMKNIIGTEDCLYLNVYVPYEQETPEEPLRKAVMVWIHGGDFYYGSGDYSQIAPDYFMRRNVILVTVNYRLGVLGFLNLGHHQASGNQGLKDQVVALRWIQENIFSFGGNPNNITIFGNGAGAISAHLLMLSPLARGLFQKAILQSGVALCNWAIKEKQSESYSLASYMGFPKNFFKEPTEVLEYLQKMPLYALLTAEANFIPKQERAMRKVIFGPTIDKESLNPFLSRPISELLHNGDDIPILIGHNMNGDELLDSCPQMADEKTITKEFLEPYVKLFAGSHNLHKVPSYIEEFMKLTGDYERIRSTPEAIKEILNDLYYIIPIRSVILSRVKQRKAKTYYYVFTYNRKNELKLKCKKHFDSKTGISLDDELEYMFYMPHKRTENQSIMTRQDYDIVEMITHSWSSFAKTGDPNFSSGDMDSTWDPVNSKNNMQVFEINTGPSEWLERRHYIDFLYERY